MKIGYSTGAVAFGDFRKALGILNTLQFDVIELSALRQDELLPLEAAINSLDLSKYQYISFHAPSSIRPNSEREVFQVLSRIVHRGWPVIVHPNIIQTPDLWASWGRLLCVENMDKRRAIGRTAKELATIFEKLPHASLCFDIGHARQIDPSMNVAFDILQRFKSRITQLHVSEVDTDSKHKKLSEASRIAFLQVLSLLPPNIPTIIESTGIPRERLEQEAKFAEEALRETAAAT